MKVHFLIKFCNTCKLRIKVKIARDLPVNNDRSHFTNANAAQKSSNNELTIKVTKLENELTRKSELLKDQKDAMIGMSAGQQSKMNHLKRKIHEEERDHERTKHKVRVFTC